MLKLNWQKEQRVSAELQCDSAAQAILYGNEAFALQHAVVAALDVPPLCLRVQALNQQAIFLMSNEHAALDEKLYAVGVLLSKCLLILDPEKIQEAGNEILALMHNGMLTESFAALPTIDTYLLTALRQLAQVNLDVQLDPLTGMTLVMKLSELALLSDAQLLALLHEMHEDELVQDFMQQQATLWRNYLLWHAYHGVFPGTTSVAWETSFLALCQRVFGIKVLISMLLVEQCVLDEATIAQLFAAWERQPLPLLQQENALLIGLSLLK
ncbi:hypothetical protein [Pantoea sp.]|uniref:hypothetical protein n=1 Tax=Pantoea sp. TaxID=69393 RepID=UPI0031DC7772